jgi:Zn-dependent protease with chaperone function
MTTADFIHPEDAAALRQMEAIPGFPLLVKKIMALGAEQFSYGLNMASTIRLSEHQLPDIYRHLPPICEKLGIAEPEFYLQMSPVPNAWTSGDTRIWITITSAMLEFVNDDELDAVIAHECGHILCRHVLYHTVASWISSGLASRGIIDKLAIPVQLALFYWSRKSELSADRVSAFVTSPETVAQMMSRLAGGPRSITQSIDMNEWAKQADQYEAIRNDGIWNKTLQMYATAEKSHPFAAVRVREVLKWGESEQFKRMINNINAGAQNICPNCKKPIDSSWSFCKYCGHRLI